MKIYVGEEYSNSKEEETWKGVTHHWNSRDEYIRNLGLLEKYLEVRNIKTEDMYNIVSYEYKIKQYYIEVETVEDILSILEKMGIYDSTDNFLYGSGDV
jgi:hypothetical protein